MSAARMPPVLPGLMQDHPLLISDLLTYAETYHAGREIVSRDAEGVYFRYDYGQAAQRARRVAAALLAQGVEPGQRIATLSMNGYRHFELFYAVSGIGAVLHTVNPRLFEDQIKYIVSHAEDRIVFVEPAFVPLLAKLLPELQPMDIYVMGTMADVVDARPLIPQALCYESLMEAAPLAQWPVFDERSASSLCYTSGTTGNPKGVLYSHRSTVIHAMAACQNSAMGISSFDVIMPIAPMYHGNGWSTPYLAPMAGAKLVLPGPRMDGQSIHSIVEQEGVTFTVGVPTVFTMLLEYLERTGKRIDTLSRATIGGSTVPPAMIGLLENKYGCAVRQVWGMTETSPLGTMTTATPQLMALPEAERKAVLHQQGRAQFGIQLQIRDQDGRPCPHDGRTAGSLWVKGPWAASGYFKNEGGRKLDDAGWFPTGDVATLDPYGYLHITDREKDVIKSGGEWISSADIENKCYEHPAVKMAAVVGVHHPKWEERPLLALVLKEGASASRDEILDHLRPHLAKWWLPDDVVFLEGLPMTATGKIRKASLRETYARHFSPG
jgi:acyl-CoA synthetase (AMP-forming)/AMP-acid ligase II